jgi:hypothetical protein
VYIHEKADPKAPGGQSREFVIKSRYCSGCSKKPQYYC